MLIDRTFRRLLFSRLLRIAGASAAVVPLAGLVGCGQPDVACIAWEAELGACMGADDALEELQLEDTCSNTVVTVDSEATAEDGACCYEVTTEDTCCRSNCPVEGRPFVLEGERVTSAARPGEAGWLARAAGGPAEPALEDLTAEERALLAAAWLRTALEEHASVASFSRFSLDLLALGAPSELVEAAHAAALDEIGHARLCFSLAAAYRGEIVGPGAFPLPREIGVAEDLAALARATAEEGCVGETLAALLAAEKRARAEDPAVRAALDVIAREEARHAELAWITVRWAIELGGEPVRRAVAEVFEAAARELAAPAPARGPRPAPDGAREEALAAHGHLDDAEMRRLSRTALAEVVLPCARALDLVSPPPAPPPDMIERRARAEVRASS